MLRIFPLVLGVVSLREKPRFTSAKTLVCLVLVILLSLGQASCKPTGDHGLSSICRKAVCSLGYLEKYKCSCEIWPLAMDPIMENREYYRSLPECTEEQRVLGLKDFQRKNGLPETGFCDASTAAATSNRQCDVADDVMTEDSSEPDQSESAAEPVGSTEYWYLDEAGERYILLPPSSLAEIEKSEENSTLLAESAAVAAPAGKSSTENKTEVLTRGKRDVRRRIRVVYREGSGESEERRMAMARKLLMNTAGPVSMPPRRSRSARRGWRGRRAAQVSHKWHPLSLTNDRSMGNGQSRSPSRSRRSTTLSGSFGFTRNEITWKPSRTLISNKLSDTAVINTWLWVFAQWAMVTPLCFSRRPSYITTDVNLSFEEGVHGKCQAPFDGPFPGGPLLGHAKPYDTVHFDKSELWVDGETTSPFHVSLTAVSLHEIGHLIGLPHTSNTQAVMYSFYSGLFKDADSLKLTSADKQAARAKYGRCDDQLDEAFDIVSPVSSTSTVPQFITYFTRGTFSWVYNNAAQEAKVPLFVHTEFPNFPENTRVDAFVQFYEFTTSGFSDKKLFFHGSRVSTFDGSRIVSTTSISSMFPSGSATLPTNLDTAFYNRIDGLLYFFKGTQVYSYSYSLSGTHRCCDAVQTIAQRFPSSWSNTNTDYTRGIDSAYFSHANSKLYFFRGSHYWEVNPSTRYVTYKGTYGNRWNYLCDPVCTT